MNFKNLPKREWIVGKKGFSCLVKYIYKLENLNNGKIYIGQTIDPEQRAKAHFDGIKKHRHSNPLLNADSDNDFSFVVIERVEEAFDFAGKRELFYIDKYRTYDESLGYNALDPKAQPLRKEAGLPYIKQGQKRVYCLAQNK